MIVRCSYLVGRKQPSRKAVESINLGLPDTGPLAGIQMVLNEKHLKKQKRLCFLHPQWSYLVLLLRQRASVREG